LNAKDRLNVKGLENLHHTHMKYKRGGAVMLISEKERKNIL
jgi:hypothetical protein